MFSSVAKNAAQSQTTSIASSPIIHCLIRVYNFLL